MSTIFGVTTATGQAVEKRDLLNFARSTEKYAPDGTFVCVQGRTGMGFQPYHTHERSKLEALPLMDAGSNILSFDGRLDNHAELCDLLDIRGSEVPDSCIVLKSFERWGQGCFSHLIGDWALALWAHLEQSLYLARDHAGTRSLYFEHSNSRVFWATHLETFFTNGRIADLDEDFAVLYLACRPTRELTPYKGIRAVPPAHYLRFHGDSVICKPHWEWVIRDSLIHDTDEQYEEHLFQLFRQSVQRRTGPGAPILAQLSGGMDSSSIVCMSDHIRQTSNPPMVLLDTVSFYDNSEPNWNEFPFFAAVEKTRGKTGLHVNTSYSDRTIRPLYTPDTRHLWPGTYGSGPDLDGQLYSTLKGADFRSVLSGIGGDEVLGGVPTPFPELADLMVRGKVFSLLDSSVDWCLANRLPLPHLLLKTLDFTCKSYLAGHPSSLAAPPWLSRQLRHRTAGGPAEASIWQRLHHPSPSKIANGDTWWSILETLPNRLLSNEIRFEYRYPFLDRDLVEFLFRIPRRQLVEPGRRRSLMRRAFKNIVPNEILERRRKAYLIRGPINLIRRERDWLAAQFKNSRCVDMGLVEPTCLPTALESVSNGAVPRWAVYLMRLITFEIWLDSAPVNIPPANMANKIRVRLPPLGHHDSEIRTN